MIEEHEPAFAYDWRTRFQLPLEAIEQGVMSWREAWQLTQQLLTDTSSRVFAAVAGWRYVWSREAFILADVYHLVAAAHTDRRCRSQLRQYPRPAGDGSRGSARFGGTTLPRQEVRSVLAARGHQL